MLKLASLMGAALIGLGLLAAAPASSQDGGAEQAVRPTLPRAGMDPRGNAPAPGETTSEAAPEGSGPSSPEAAGCPLHNRKLELIV